MPRKQLSEALDEALNRKTEADLALLKFRDDVEGGVRSYSHSGLLSALERCDEAQQGVWQVAKSSMLQAAE